MCGHASTCGWVGCGNEAANHSRTAGENPSSTGWWAPFAGMRAGYAGGVMASAAIAGASAQSMSAAMAKNMSNTATHATINPTAERIATFQPTATRPFMLLKALTASIAARINSTADSSGDGPKAANARQQQSKLTNTCGHQRLITSQE